MASFASRWDSSPPSTSLIPGAHSPSTFQEYSPEQQFTYQGIDYAQKVDRLSRTCLGLDRTRRSHHRVSYSRVAR